MFYLFLADAGSKTMPSSTPSNARGSISPVKGNQDFEGSVDYSSTLREETGKDFRTREVISDPFQFLQANIVV